VLPVVSVTLHAALEWSVDTQSDPKRFEHESLTFLQASPGVEIRNLLCSWELKERPGSIDQVVLNFDARTGVASWRKRSESRALVLVKSDKYFNGCFFHDFASHGINGDGPAVSNSILSRSLAGGTRQHRS
jgi:hypothetical protein